MDSISRYRGIDPQILQLKEARKGRCLLSIDGGGVRGISQLVILEELAYRLMHDLGLSELPRLCDYFDMIGGVGTGGYLAILAGRLGLTVPQVKEEFKQLIKRVLKSPMSPEDLDGYLKAVVERYTGDAETRMLDPNSLSSHCKTFVGAIAIADASYLTTFRSYQTRHELPVDIPIWQAVRATLAHPDLFPPISIGSNVLEQVYITGELGWKNPSNEVVREFEALWPSQRIACLASIGSGHEGVIQIDGSFLPKSVAAAMQRIATDCEKIAQELAYRFQGRNTYFRLNVEQGLQHNVVHRPLTIPDIQSITSSYLRTTDASDALDKLVTSLLHSIELSPWTSTREQFEKTIDGYITEYSKLVEDISVASVRSTVNEGVLLLKAIRDVKSSEEYWIVLARMIHHHLNSMNCRMIIDLREPLSSNTLWVSIRDYFTEVKVVRRNLRQLVRINPHRIWGPPTHDTFLAKATTDLDKSFNQIPTAVLNEIHDQIVLAKQDARFDEFITWISQLDMGKRHQDIQTRRSKGTGEWLLETPEFKSWLSTKAEGGCRALLGFGDPGAGKTFICCFAIEYLRDRLGQHQAALGYFYFDFGDKDNQTACAVLGELAKQLLLQAPSIPEDVWKLFEKHTTISMEKAEQILISLLRSFELTYICLDALDECEPRSRRTLLGFLTTLKKKYPLRIFCTGRFNIKAEVTEILQSFHSQTVEITAHEADIRQYLIETIAQDRHKEAMDDQLQEEIMKQLISRSQTLFILPALQLDFILEQATKRKRTEALTTMPTKLFEMYTITIGRILKQPTAQAKMAVTMLAWIYLSLQKLSVGTLQHALAVQPGDVALREDDIPSEKALLDCCLGLVVIERETSTIRLTHFTLQEYLEKNWKRLFPSGHSLIASTCLTYLNFPHPDLPLKGYQKRVPLLVYAAKFVDSHMREETNKQLDIQLLKLIINESKARLLRKILRINDSYGPLHWVAYFGIISLFQSVLMKVDPTLINTTTSSRETALGIAARYGRDAVVRLLLGVPGVNVHSRDLSLRTPLSYAAGNGHELAVRLLLSVDQVDMGSSSGQILLSYTPQYVREARLFKRFFGTREVGANSRDESGQTPLSYAAEHGHDAVVRVLLGVEGVDVNLDDNIGRTALSHAAGRGHEAVVRRLLNVWGVDAHSRDVFGETPLSHAAGMGREAVVRLMLNVADVDVNSRSNWGQTPLSYAAENGYEGVVRMLIDAGGYIDSRAENGRTPLSYAAENDHEAVVRLLLSRDAEINSRDSLGWTPLSYAVRNERQKLAGILRDAGGVE